MTHQQDEGNAGQQRANETQQFENVSQQEQNIEQQDANLAQQHANVAIGPLILTLTDEVHELRTAWDRVKWQRRTLWVLVLGMLLVGALYYHDVTDRRRANQAEIRDLACTIVASVPNNPARPEIAAFRAKYHCPPFTPRAVGRPLPTVTKTATTPGPTLTVHATATATPARVTRTLSGPSITVTRTRVVAHPATRTVTATATRTCVLICTGG